MDTRYQSCAGQLQSPLTERFPGLIIERKGVTATIHLRGVEQPQEAEDAVYTVVADAASADGLRVTRGKMVVELRPPLEIDKGVSIESFIRTRGLRGALYLGDDQTDIDAFQNAAATDRGWCLPGVAVAVLHSEAPAHLAAEADMSLPSAEAVPGFLRWLLANTPTVNNLSPFFLMHLCEPLASSTIIGNNRTAEAAMGCE